MIKRWLRARRWASCERDGHLVYDAEDGLRCARCGCNILCEVSPR